MDAEEFTIVAWSLPSLFKHNRDIVLLVIDGLHQFEMNDILQDEKEEQVFDIPDANDFLFQQTDDVIMRESGAKKRQHRVTSKLDPKNFEKKLVDTSLQIIKEIHKTYKFAVIKLAAKLYIRKAC